MLRAIGDIDRTVIDAQKSRLYHLYQPIGVDVLVDALASRLFCFICSSLKGFRSELLRASTLEYFGFIRGIGRRINRRPKEPPLLYLSFR